MKCYNRKPAAWEKCVKHTFDRFVEPVQLAVDLNSQGLKSLSRGVTRTFCRGGNRIAYNRRELKGSLDCFLGSVADNAFCDCRSELFVRIFIKDILNFTL